MLTPGCWNDEFVGDLWLSTQEAELVMATLSSPCRNTEEGAVSKLQTAVLRPKDLREKLLRSQAKSRGPARGSRSRSRSRDWSQEGVRRDRQVPSLCKNQASPTGVGPPRSSCSSKEAPKRAERPVVPAAAASSSAAPSASAQAAQQLGGEGVKLEPPLETNWPVVEHQVDGLGLINLNCLEVFEVESQEEKSAAMNLHLSKSTFQEERDFVQWRIFSGDACRCRTWVLVQPRTPDEAEGRCLRGRSTGGGDRGVSARPRRRSVDPAPTPANAHIIDTSSATFLSALTARINPYQKRAGKWAQILNMSTRRERQGFGTVMLAGFEELLRREEVDVVVLYPADNGRAPGFWSSIGYGARSPSFLPEEELISHDKGGPLLPEYDPGSKETLPRWEKRLKTGQTQAATTAPVLRSRELAADKEAAPVETRRRALKGKSPQDWRPVQPSESRLHAEECCVLTAALRAYRASVKAKAAL
mmetsp:Transcript_115728/g.258647  ORF Transcript_115728/g.258647 Transcript_115728/m.258647 type:complete len:474 (-) Transcript_115728:42-1463(-)